ncbi:MAG TPA: FtsX-like permease family protein [Saprospiraceae bacterium]|nr:FtsX-like permease family protein [Saprospiraceae bacterium]
MSTNRGNKSFVQFMRHRIGGVKRSRISLVINIAVWSMGLSFAALIVASSVIRGFKEEISKKIFDFWGHIHITSSNIYQNFESDPIRLDRSLMNEIASTTQYQAEIIDDRGELVKGDTENVRVERVTPFITLPVLMESSGEMEGIFLKALEGSAAWKKDYQPYLLQGSFDSLQSNPEALIVSETTSRRLGLSKGDLCLVHWISRGKQKTKRLRIQGIYKTGLIEYDKSFALSSMLLLQDLQSWDQEQITGYEISIDDPNKAESFNNYIFYQILPLDWFSSSVIQRFRNIFQWLQLQGQNEIVLIFLLSVVVLSNLGTIFLILIIDRIKMIGVLKALGARSSSVRNIFIHLGLRVILKSLLIGNTIGLSICLIQKYFHVLKLSEDDYYLSYAPVQINLSYLLLMNVGAVIVSLLFMLVPSLFIARVRPLRTIRFD